MYALQDGGDTLQAHPIFNATRAVTIAVPPASIWPWLVQMGHDRAGWYSWDRLDNFGKRSAEEIYPELENLPFVDAFRYFMRKPRRWSNASASPP